MKITTPNGILEGENIEAILKEHGFDCLHGADLRHANLSHASLRYADLRSANLSYADLSLASLRYADLRYADLYGAGLSLADLSYAYLSHASLRSADLRSADLYGADLRHADLRYADLHDANHVKLSIAEISILPDEGDIIGWKKANADSTTPVIVKLLIPTDAQRSNSTGRKCRASKAQVLDLQDKQGNSLPPDSTAHSSYNPDFTYKKGETIHVEDFDTNRWNECAPGIHFFITRIEATEY
ncbi:pentapeptide repeat-containing protein [Bifidobacterium longum]|uniref:pentapeptide repeat-containing protein n=1 Tax=Bifidobacterium longum TaxID=216816 RepID=UPI0019258425|nr:pentapeptide repeat-containing protein [Bifidobacterium longum]MBL3897901.1 pentapeptide repeat-containing protein [Bifidobacterium longum subsp. suis]